MESGRIMDLVENIAQDIVYVIREVAERGFEEVEQEADNYTYLRLRREFKDLVIGELYESYFLPDRHEFDWTIVSNVVEVMTSPEVIKFIELSVAAGVAGNAAHEVLKRVLGWVVNAMKKAAWPESRREPYERMALDVEKIRQFFEEREDAGIKEVEAAISVPRERIYPLLKILGFSHYRRERNCLWRRPGI